jgi:hypothetical protein
VNVKYLSHSLVFLAGVLVSDLGLAGPVAVDRTPYDLQMAPVRGVLMTASRSGNQRDGELEEVRGLLGPIYRMPYRYRNEWMTPAQVQQAGRADCKGKSILLMEQMTQRGFKDLRFVIGKRSTSSGQTHAWLEWNYQGTIYILDPTFSSRPIHKGSIRRGQYLTHYSFVGDKRFSEVPDAWLVAAR